METTSNYSKYEERVREIACKFLKKEKIFNVKFIGEGDNNVNYLVSDESEIVVKLSKPESEYKALNDYNKEKWCLSKAHELGIPSPKVLELGQHDSKAFLIETYIAGSPVALLDETSIFSNKEKLKAWRKLGEYTRKINSVSVSGWGDSLVGDSVFEKSWDEHIQYNINSLNDNDVLKEMGIFDKQLSRKIKEMFQSLKNKKFTFGLCHSDIALRNAIMDSNEEVYLLDWGSARAEIVPHYELNVILKDSKPDQETLKAFLDGYGITQREFIEMKQVLSILNLLNEIDTLRWAIDRMPNAVNEHIVSVKNALVNI